MKAELREVLNTGEHVIWLKSKTGNKMLYARFKADEFEEAQKELERIKKVTKGEQNGKNY